MSVDDLLVRRNASEATIPDEDIITECDGLLTPAVKSDRKPSCWLSEGHKVVFLATAPDDDTTPTIEQIHCYSAHCDHHHFPDDPESLIDCTVEDVDADCCYIGTARLRADYDESGDEITLDGLGITDVELADYREVLQIPLP